MRYERATWKELKKAVDEEWPLVLPSGALTQYGPHLPVGANSLVTHRLALRAADRTNLVVAPPHWYGFAYPDAEGRGGVTVDPSTLTALIQDTLVSFARTGFSKLVLFYGQLPNVTSLNRAAQNLTASRGEHSVAVVAWWQLAKGSLRELFSEETGYHAESSETSLMMALEPSLVRSQAVRDDSAKVSIGYDLYPRPTASRSESGVVGRPTLASPEKGERLVEEIVNNLVDLLEHDLVFESVWNLLHE